MSTRQRPGDLGEEAARHHYQAAAREIRDARRGLGMSMDDAATRAGISAAQLGRIERGLLEGPTLVQICRAAQAVGLDPSLKLYPSEVPVRDRGQLLLLGRFEQCLAPPLRLRREVALPLARDQRAWDGRIDGDPDGRTASVEGEARLGDVQALGRRIALKQRDDPQAGFIILVVNRTAHNRRVLDDHREALRLQFPLDGAAILRSVRAGRVPASSGIVLL